MARAGELGADQALTFLREVDAINMRRRARMVDLARELAGGSFHGCTVAVLGAAFKPNSDDIRDSPALDVAVNIREQGGQVTVYDPVALDNARKAHPALGFGYVGAGGRPGRGRRAAADRVAGVPRPRPRGAGRTSWPPARSSTAATPSTPETWRAAGWHYRALGRP